MQSRETISDWKNLSFIFNPYTVTPEICHANLIHPRTAKPEYTRFVYQLLSCCLKDLFSLNYVQVSSPVRWRFLELLRSFNSFPAGAAAFAKFMQTADVSNSICQFQKYSTLGCPGEPTLPVAARRLAPAYLSVQGLMCTNFNVSLLSGFENTNFNYKCMHHLKCLC